MTVTQIQKEVMFQTNNDADDLGDYMPYLMDYINEGYDRLLQAFRGEHLGGEDDPVPPLERGDEILLLPPWTHRALVDWATWLVYRNGNPQKQSRGYPFRNAFEETVAKITAAGGNAGRPRRFINIPE